MAAPLFDAGRALPRTIAVCPVPVSYGKRLWRFCRIANYRVQRRFLFALFNGVGGQQTLGGLYSTHGTPRTRGPGKLLGLPRTAAPCSGQRCFLPAPLPVWAKQQTANLQCSRFLPGLCPRQSAALPQAGPPCPAIGNRQNTFGAAYSWQGTPGPPPRLFFKKNTAQG